MKHVKKSLAALLAVMMGFSLMTTPVQAKSDKILNEEDPVPTEVTEESAEEAKEEQPEVPEEVQEETPAEEEVAQEEAPAAEEEQPAEEEAVPEEEEEQPAEEAPEEGTAEAEEKTSAPEEGEPEEKEIEYPAQSFFDEIGNYTIDVDAPEGAFPDGTDMVVTPITEQKVFDAAEEAVEGEAKTVVAFDISFVYAEEGEEPKEIEPIGEITVKISTNEINESSNLSVVHIDDHMNAQKLDEEKVDSDEESVTFTSDEFSIYVIVDGSETVVTPRRTYVFMSDLTGTKYEFVNKAGALVNTQIIKNGDALEEVGEPYFTGKEFVEWRIATKGSDDTSYTLTDTTVAFETEINDVTEDETVYVVPKYNTIYYVTFHENAKGSADDVILTKRVTDTEGNVLISDVIAPQPDEGHIFYGWINASDEREYPIYVNHTITPTTITLTEDTDLYPLFVEAYWLRFVSGETGSGASHVAAQFLMTNEAATSLPVPTRKGYDFDGWYTGSITDNVITYGDQVTDENGTVINPSSGLTISEDTTLYGKWTARTDATYKVVIWKQKVTDKKNAADAEKTYDYAESEVRTGRTGDPAETTEADVSHSGGDYTGFHYARTVKTSETIKANGSTVVNVYYDRDLVAVNFYYQQNGQNAYEYSVTTSDNGTQYGLLEDGTYVQLTRQTGTPITRVYYTYDAWYGRREYTGTFYIRRGSQYTATQYNGNNLPPAGDNTTYYTSDLDWGVGRVALTRRTESTSTYNWTYVKDGVTYPYTGTRYTRSSLSNYRLVTWTGLYGQSFSQNGYTYPTDRQWGEHRTGQTTVQTFLTDFNRTGVYNLYDRGSQGESVIYHYKQGLDGKYSQSESDPTLRYTAHGSGGTFHFEDKFTGFEVKTYNTGNNGFNAGGGSNKISSGTTANTYPLHVYHERKKWEITYVSEGEDVKVSEKIYYEAPLNDYNLSQEAAGLPDKPHYVFTGWYADETCTQHYNFETGTMPNANVVVYAGWEPVKYRVNLYPEGGVITQDIGGTYFNVNYEEKVNEYTIERKYIEDPNGDYKYVFVDGAEDPDGNNQVRTATYELAEEGYEGTRYRPMTAEDDVYTLIGWYLMDENGNKTETPYDFDEPVEAPLNIYAKWRLSGFYTIQYNPVVTVDGKQVSGQITQSDATVKYADGSEFIINNAPTNVTTGYVFEGWEIVDSFGEPITVLEDNLYKPGDEVILNAAHWSRGRVVHIQAKYKKVEESDIPTATTFIIFDANGGEIAEGNKVASNTVIQSINDSYTTAPDEELAHWEWIEGNEYKQLKKSKMLINAKTEWPFEFNYEYDGYELMGWNTDKTRADNGEVEFELGTVFGADNLPDKANTLYAVWCAPYYIYHSADNTVEKKTAKVNEVIDLTKLIKSNTLYGGYYEGYGKTTSSDADIKALSYGSSGIATDPNGQAYTGTTIDQTAWDGDQVYTASGKTLKPKAGKVYYLKEVPNTYLAPYTHCTYYTYDNKISSLYFVSVIDDANYDTTGFKIVSENKEATKITKKLKITALNSGSQKIITADTFSVTGYVTAYSDKLGNLTEQVGDEFIVRQYWVTYDGVEVTGKTARKITAGDGTYQEDQSGPGLKTENITEE